MVDSPLTKTPLTTFVIDEEDTSAFDLPQLKRDRSKFREHPRHSSQTDFNDFIKKREEEEKENHFDSQISFILNSFAKQYMREYIKMKIKTSVYDTIDKELNRKSFTSIPQYYHLRKKQPNSKDNTNHSQGFQPVYSLRIASSRTEIGADKNEYTAYIIVGSRISPFDSKITVCVKRFTELRTFASEIVRRLNKNGKELKLQNKFEFPYHTRLFGTIDSKQLEFRRTQINTYLESICSDENVVRHSYFLSFFDFNDGQYTDYTDYKINTENESDIYDKYLEQEFRLKCIEETLEIIGMNGGIPIDCDIISNISDSDNDDENEFKQLFGQGLLQTNSYLNNNQDEQLELNFEVPYDLHHYKDPQYKLVAAIFDIIQQQLEIKENNIIEDNNGNKKPTHVSTNSQFMNSINQNMLNNINENINIDNHIHLNNGNNMNNMNNISDKPKHSRKHSGGVIAPSPLKHIRAQSIIESSFTPATPMEFHPSITTFKLQSSIANNNAAATGGLETIDDSIPSIETNINNQQWTSARFKNKFNSSIRGIDGGPRIIRTASEATSDRSLSYKIPTMVSQVWNKITQLLDNKKLEIPKLLSVVNKDLYPIIQEAMNDVAPIIKLLYNNNPINPIPQNIQQQPHDNNNNNNNKQNNNKQNNNNNNKQQHGKYLSMFGYDGDEDSSSDSDGSEIRRSVGIKHFPYINAMREYCKTESRLYEFFLAFENLAIDQIFGDINIIFGDNNNNKNKNNKKKEMINNNKNKNKRAYKSSVDFGNFMIQPNTELLPHYIYINLLRYNYSILNATSSIDFCDRIQHIERMHSQINLQLCEIIYAILKCFMKCLGDIILYKDLLEEKYSSSGSTFDQDVISNHEDSLLNILRDSGYNISFIVDDLKQKIKSEFKDYSSVIFNPLLDGICTIGEISLNCICLMISQFVFDDGEFPRNIEQFRESFINIWFEPIDYYIADFTECVFYILYQSSIGLVHSASQDLLQNNIFNYASSSTSHSSSTWYQILRGQNIKNIKKFIPKILNKNISVKDILDLVIERTLTNIVDETLIYIKLECEKAFFLKFQKKEQRLFNHDF